MIFTKKLIRLQQEKKTESSPRNFLRWLKFCFSICFQSISKKADEDVYAYIVHTNEEDELKSMAISDQLLEVNQIIKVK
jgi:hypothetical protein